MTRRQRKRIGFFTDGPPFDGGTLDERALGGSETAFIQAARALAERGHDVTVFNRCLRPGVYDGVTYIPADRFPQSGAGPEYDVFIVSRYYDFFRNSFESRLKVLWNHDTLDRPESLRNVLDRIDLMFVLSRFHRDNYLTRIPEADAMVLATRNGIDLGLIDRSSAGVEKDPGKIIYASRPERGLVVLLEDIWPRLTATRPDLTLYLCGYTVDRSDLAPGLAELYERLDRLTSSEKNIRVLGPLTKDRYYRHLAESALMLYPCTFPEISCIAALEAQACRTPILTTDGFALAETVKVPELRVPGRPGSAEYNEDFIRRGIGLLNDPDAAARLADGARRAVETEYTWEAITAEWDRAFDLHLASRRRPRRADAPARPDRSSVPRKGTERLTALVIDTGYYLVREVTRALRVLGHHTARARVPIDGANPAAAMGRLLERIKAVRPDFLLTVNHLGFDSGGVLTGLLEKIRLPFASWFVDSPTFILGDGVGNTSPIGSIFLWDADYLEDVRRLGFDKVHHLALATDETVFRPPNGAVNPLDHLASPVCFVGDSMVRPVQLKASTLGLDGGRLSAVDDAARRFMQDGHRLPDRAMAATGMMKHDWVVNLPPARMDDLRALITWRATQLYRLDLIRAVGPLGPRVVGDAGWRTVLDAGPFRLAPELDYYNELPLLYPISRVNLNITSMQMKTGLNQRIFDVPACGAFLLTDKRRQIEDLFEPGREVIWYEGAEELSDLAAYYLGHETERRAVIERARARVLAEHTYTKRLDELVRYMRREHGL